MMKVMAECIGGGPLDGDTITVESTSNRLRYFCPDRQTPWVYGGDGVPANLPGKGVIHEYALVAVWHDPSVSVTVGRLLYIRCQRGG